MVQGRKRRVGDRTHRRRTRSGVKERQLAEHLTGTEHRQEVLAPVRGRPRDLHLAVDHDKEPVAGVTFSEHDVAPVDGARRHRYRQRVRGLVIERSEQRQRAERAVHAVIVSQIPSFKRARLA